MFSTTSCCQEPGRRHASNAMSLRRALPKELEEMSNVCFGLSVPLRAHFGAFVSSATVLDGEAWWRALRLCQLCTLEGVVPMMKVLQGASLWVLRPVVGGVHDEKESYTLWLLLFCLLPSFLTEYWTVTLHSLASGMNVVFTYCSVSRVGYNSTVPEMTFLSHWPKIHGAERKCFANEESKARTLSLDMGSQFVLTQVEYDNVGRHYIFFVNTKTWRFQIEMGSSESLSTIKRLAASQLLNSLTQFIGNINKWSFMAVR